VKALLVILLLAGLAGGCSFGMTAKKFRVTESPHGIETSITIADLEFAGELIEVRDTGLVLLSERRIAPIAGGTIEAKERRLRLIPFAAVRRSRFEQMDRRLYLVDGRAPTNEDREELRLVSRFPQGLSAEVLSRLLKEHGQTELAGMQP